jgi:hypothetical protein
VRKLKIIFTAVLFLLSMNFFGQDTVRVVNSKPITPKEADSLLNRPERRWGDVGIGFGLDYGGLFGVKASFNPIPYMAVFASGGWELIAFGWNVGVLGRLFPAGGPKHVRPYFKVMYGVNGAITVSGLSAYDEVYYGVTPGIGMEARFGKIRRSGLNVDFNVPLRSGSYFYDLNEIKNNPAIVMKGTPLPISVSFGYHYEF